MAYRRHSSGNSKGRQYSPAEAFKKITEALRVLRETGGAGANVPNIETGGFEDIEGQVAKFLASDEVQSFSVTNPLRRVFVPMSKTEGKVKLMLFVNDGQTEVVKVLRRLFRKPELGKGEKLGLVVLPMPKGKSRMVKVIKELLVEGYGLEEDERLLFHFRAGVRKKLE